MCAGASVCGILPYEMMKVEAAQTRENFLQFGMFFGSGDVGDVTVHGSTATGTCSSRGCVPGGVYRGRQP